MPFLVKTKPKINISFDSKDAEPHNTPTNVTYHRDLDVGSILIYWHTLMEHVQNPSDQTLSSLERQK